MKVKIKRFNSEKKSFIEEYETQSINILEALNDIKEKDDNTLTYRCGCRSGICGSCALRVNGVEKLACKTTLNDNDLIEPLKNLPIIKDLIVDVSRETSLIKETKSHLNTNSNEAINHNDIKKIDIQSNCILCSSCYSSCPIYDVNDKFQGPYALSRALRYVDDKKEADKHTILESIQNNGIWDCTLCSACTFVCPQEIDPKSDILNLQNISVQNGFTNPNFNNFNVDFGFDMGDDSGFNPNSF
jgi:fumarate reductase iron-sulfur subunit